MSNNLQTEMMQSHTTNSRPIEQGEAFPRFGIRSSLRTVSMDALVKRINRTLAVKNVKLRKTRGERSLSDLGEYWVQNYWLNMVVATHVDPVKLATELGVLSPGETVRG